MSCKSIGSRCRYCWMPRCHCRSIRANTQPPCCGIEWVIVSHPNEFLRSTSTAKVGS
jgi:DTW domain-containing protein YfiP